MTQPAPLTDQQLADIEAWKRRALRAEGAVYHALWMRPLGPHWAGDGIETAEQMRARFRQHMEHTYPDLITRYEHQRVEVYQIADGCGCDPEADDYEDVHAESSDDGEFLCSKKRLGFICDSCEDEDGDGPSWKPYAVEWPCPPVAALAAAPAASGAPVTAGHGTETAEGHDAPCGPPDGPESASGVAEVPELLPAPPEPPQGRTGDPGPVVVDPYSGIAVRGWTA